MTNPTLPTISPADLQAFKAAVRRAVSDLAGEAPDEKRRLANKFYARIYRRYGIDRLADLPAVAFGDVLAWLKEQSRPTPCAGLEARAAEARAALVLPAVRDYHDTRTSSPLPCTLSRRKTS